MLFGMENERKNSDYHVILNTNFDFTRKWENSDFLFFQIKKKTTLVGADFFVVGRVTGDQQFFFLGLTKLIVLSNKDCPGK